MKMNLLSCVVLSPLCLFLFYQMNTSSLVSRYTQRPLSFSLSKSSLAFGDNVTASWSIPKDEATHMDWIGEPSYT